MKNKKVLISFAVVTALTSAYAWTTTEIYTLESSQPLGRKTTLCATRICTDGH